MPSTEEGHIGNLTPEHEVKLREFWQALFEIFAVPGSEKADGNTAAASAATTATPEPDSGKRKSRLGWLRGHKDATSGSDSDKASVASDASADDKHGLNKEYKRALADMSPEAIRDAFWTMSKADDADALLLRFLRARKWVVHDALVMLISTLHWRTIEIVVDAEVMFKGDGGLLREAARNDVSATQKKDAEGFVKQFRQGKSSLHGVDKEGRPITIVRAALHHPGEESEHSLEMFTVWTIETARLMLQPPVETATILFDMTDFSLSNMDYAPVKFMIKCFEANYPESLGSVLVYRAPWIFQGIWKIIRGWLDPVVASKINFVADETALQQFIEQARIPKRLGGGEDWEAKYIEPVDGEDEKLNDEATRAELKKQRKEISERLERDTLRWIKDGEGKEERTKSKADLRENYWKLDPYVRARGTYDRLGVIKPGGVVDYYPHQAGKATTGVATDGDVD